MHSQPARRAWALSGEGAMMRNATPATPRQEGRRIAGGEAWRRAGGNAEETAKGYQQAYTAEEGKGCRSFRTLVSEDNFLQSGPKLLVRGWLRIELAGIAADSSPVHGPEGLFLSRAGRQQGWRTGGERGEERGAGCQGNHGKELDRVSAGSASWARSAEACWVVRAVRPVVGGELLCPPLLVVTQNADGEGEAPSDGPEGRQGRERLMRIRLGDVLVRLGVLSEEQRGQVVEAQRASGRPFGVLAEEMFGVPPKAVERAWAEQYADLTGRVRLAEERADAAVLSRVERRQAWQFQIVPMRIESGELVIATTELALPRAMRFVGWVLGEEASFVIAEEEDLLARLSEVYPMPGGRTALRGARLSA